ncbi:allophanate hydrolase subunit 1 [Mesorhizobium sp. WSM4887]|uniref:5-oxoprolinase subunit B family protein n=1 Tax=Mesorhizobium sp. WSM4887 TaxID=3038543 RepID=UPI002416D26D|nr:allophanate hydrolase subunit 1 [Mesorhizobium sp. WSM4887]MDG4889793.1 allophanate hydrolase subunit 1 [Mesorhizobium sp. WSM4887]
MSLNDRLRDLNLDGVIKVIPTCRSLLIQFDPDRLHRDSLVETISGTTFADARKRHSDLWHIPVCYGGGHGIDLSVVAQTNELTTAEVIARHSAPTYRIFMIGFAPGFAYLGGLDRTLHTSRRLDPRIKTPPRSISIGGMQTALSPPIEIPSGWNLIGQTAVRTYDAQRNTRPFLFGPGDYIRFHPIKPSEYRRQLKAVEDGDIVAASEKILD